MCGIIFIKRTDGRSPNKTLAKRYQLQKDRGTEGFGFVMIKDGAVVAYERAETEQEIFQKLSKVEGDEVLFHHRFPTSVENVWEASHPIKVSNEKLKYDYYLVHNGIMTETDLYKEKHEKDGFKYSTEVQTQFVTGSRIIIGETAYNDSETLAIELARDLDEGGEGVYLNGSVAFIMLQVTKEGKLVKRFWGRNSWNPLVTSKLDGVFETITSEGRGESIKENKIYEYDYSTKATSCRDYHIGMKIIGFTAEAEKDEDYFILLERYDDLRDKYEKMRVTGKEDQELLHELDDVEDKISTIEAELDTSVLQANPT